METRAPLKDQLQAPQATGTGGSAKQIWRAYSYFHSSLRYSMWTLRPTPITPYQTMGLREQVFSPKSTLDLRCLTKVPRDWKTFMSSEKNKPHLISFLLDEWKRINMSSTFLVRHKDYLSLSTHCCPFSR